MIFGQRIRHRPLRTSRQCTVRHLRTCRRRLCPRIKRSKRAWPSRHMVRHPLGSGRRQRYGNIPVRSHRKLGRMDRLELHRGAWAESRTTLRSPLDQSGGKRIRLQHVARKRKRKRLPYRLSETDPTLTDISGHEKWVACSMQPIFRIIGTYRCRRVVVNLGLFFLIAFGFCISTGFSKIFHVCSTSQFAFRANG